MNVSEVPNQRKLNIQQGTINVIYMSTQSYIIKTTQGKISGLFCFPWNPVLKTNMKNPYNKMKL